MIKIDRIRIQEFRGIRDLSLTLDGKNFAICGPNGTGKSGIVDAIEFALTGNISRLAGSGTGDLSVKDHAPHVDFHAHPERSVVTIDIQVISSTTKKTGQIQRSVKTPGRPKVIPQDDPEILGALDNIKLHPEFVLSRLELIKFILTQPGKRSEQIQALLKLDDIEKIRKILQKIANSYARALPSTERAYQQATANLTAALVIQDLQQETILQAVNLRRRTLGLQPIEILDNNTSVKQGLTDAAIKTNVIPKIQIAADLAIFKKELTTLQSDDFIKLCKNAESDAITLVKNPEFCLDCSRESIFNEALKVFDGKSCPVCDTPFDPTNFNRLLTTKLSKCNTSKLQRDSLKTKIQPISDEIVSTGKSLAKIIEHSNAFFPQVNITKLSTFKGTLLENFKKLQDIFPIENICEAINSICTTPDITDTLNELQNVISAIPEPTEQDKALEFLIIAQERLEAFSKAREEHKKQEDNTNKTAKIYSLYSRTTNESLENIYKNVAKTFSDYYRRINEDDEKSFTAELLPSEGKLALDVDFYGRGNFPPGAYHSEGHQDGMGLCLYLALMKHLQTNNFSLAVLDDVLTSIDNGHRRQVCELLKTEFHNTQFILTTHDKVWFEHMKTQGLVEKKDRVEFRTWTVNVGPAIWDDRDIWNELTEHLNQGDVRSAAALLRHFLEYFSEEACGHLHAPVEFKSDGRYCLGDLLPPAISTFDKLLNNAKTSAQSWKRPDIFEQITQFSTHLKEVHRRTQADNWQINAAVHFNNWANLGIPEFSPLVKAFKELVAMLYCPNCGGMYHLILDGFEKDSLRCQCGSMNFNLRVNRN